MSHGLSFNGTKDEVMPIRSRVEPFDFWLDVSCLDPTMVRTFWSFQTCLWPQKAHLRPIWAILRPYGAPWWPFRTRKMVPTHPPRYVLPWSNLDPHWSTILKPPGMHMARSAIYGTFWTVFGHKMGQNGWIKKVSPWIKPLLNLMDQIHVLVFAKWQLRKSPPS